MVNSIICGKDWTEANVMLLGANYDHTSSFGKGACNGPLAIKYCLDRQIEFFEPYTRTSPAEFASIAYGNLGELNYSISQDPPYVPLVVKPEAMVKTVTDHYLNVFSKNMQAFIILLGGEHSVSLGAFEAFTWKYNPARVTVVAIDAHLDLRNDDADYHDTPWGPLAHSCVMRRAVETGYHTLHIGTRAFSKDEYAFMKEHNLPVFYWLPGHIIPPVAEIIKAIATDYVYLTIDIDGIDPAHMPATGTPVPGGLGWNYLFEFLWHLFRDKNVIGADIVEVAPQMIGHDGFVGAADRLTAWGAAQLCYTLIALHQINRRETPCKINVLTAEKR